MTKVEPSEGQEETIGKLTLLLKISLVLACVGFLLVVIPGGLDGWLTYTVVVSSIGYKNEIRVGIFYACSDDDGCEPDEDSINQWQWDAAYLYGTAIIVNVATLVAMVIHFLKYQMSWAVYPKYVAAVGAFLSWIFVFASDFILVANRDNVSPLLPEFDIDVGLVLSICGGVLYLIVTVLMSVDVFFYTP